MEIYDEHMKSAPTQLHDFVGTAAAAAKENFEFGAEIVTSEFARKDSEVPRKTNGAKITITAESSEHNNVATTTTTLNFLNVNENAVDVDTKHCNGNSIIIESAEQDTRATAAAASDLERQHSSDDSTSDSNFSDLSGLSEVSGQDWKPRATRPINWVHQQINSGANPRELISQMFSFSAPQISPNLNDMALWRILINMLSEPPRRKKLEHINTFEDVLQLVRTSKQIIVLTGAGVSVSCGIPDFRSSDGIYARLAKDYPDLPDPQAMFDINYFVRDPRPFFKFAREIYPGQFKPSPCHQFIRLLEQKGKLLRNYTQNIDTLEQVAGIQNVIECHGSFSTASCTKCKHKCTADDIRADIFAQRIPVCPVCQPHVLQSVDASEPVCMDELTQLVSNGIMKPDIVFFGEGLPERFHTVMSSDKDNCDLLIVIGSSLKVRPVALIPSSIPSHVPQILINREHLGHLEFDIELLGDSDVIINQLCHCLGDDWQQICYNDNVLQECNELLPLEAQLGNDIRSVDDATARLQDVDTQSLKSNASTDIGLRSDSGFESSTSSGMVMNKSHTVGLGPHSGGSSSSNASVEAVDAMEKIKSSVLELKKPLIRSIDLLSPELLNEHSDAVDYQNFKNVTAERHISSDSSTKDSGIQCETTAVNANVETQGNFNVNAENAVAKVVDSAEEAAAVNLELSKSNSTTECVSSNMRLPKRVSVAERLPTGCYLYPLGGSAYIFPGAVVSWSSESDDEEEEEEEEDEEEEDDEEEECDDGEEVEEEDDDDEQQQQQCVPADNDNTNAETEATTQTLSRKRSATTDCEIAANDILEQIPPNKRQQRSLSINLETDAFKLQAEEERLEAANSNRDNPIRDTGSTFMQQSN